MYGPHYEADDKEFPADAYRVRGYDGVAFYVKGWETEPDEDTEWSGYENRTGKVVVVMVGDDYKHVVDRDDVVELDPKAFCRDCGQIGCGCNVYE